MKKSFVFFLLAGAAFAQGPGRGFGGGFGPMGGRAMGALGGPLVTGAPYSATQVVQSTEAFVDGNSISKKHTTNVFRDSQGRVRTEETVTPPASSGKQPFTVITILDYVGGYRYVLDSATMKGHQSPLHARPASDGTQHTPPAGVVKTTLGQATINGVLATGTQEVRTIQAGQIGNEKPIQITRVTWISNDLKIPVQIKGSDPRFGMTDMELTNIVQAEPNASLFVVPAGYTIEKGGRGFGPGPQNRGPRGR